MYLAPAVYLGLYAQRSKEAQQNSVDHPRVGWGLPRVSGHTPRQDLPLPGVGLSSAKRYRQVSGPRVLREVGTCNRCLRTIDIFFTLENFKYIPKSGEGAFIGEGYQSRVAQTRLLKPQKCVFTVLEARSPRSGYQQGLPLEVPGSDLFQISPQGSGDFMACDSIAPAFTWYPPSA